MLFSKNFRVLSIFALIAAAPHAVLAATPAGDTTVTSKRYVDNKIPADSTAHLLVTPQAAGGNATKRAITTAGAGITGLASSSATGATNIPTAYAVKEAISGAVSGADISGHTVNGAPLSNAASYYYGTGAGTANTAAKTVTISSITADLAEGMTIVVTPATTSSVANPTLNLNSKGAKAIKYNNSTNISAADSGKIWTAGVPSVFVYDGTNWVFAGHGYDKDTTYTQGGGISISGTTITNTGVRGVATGTGNDGTISVNTNGTSADVAVKGWANKQAVSTADYQMGKAGGGWTTMTEAQQDALNSGITSTKVTNYDNHLANTTVHITASERTAWNAKEDSANKLPQGTATTPVITSTSDDTKFPTAKAVYTALNAQSTSAGNTYQPKSTAAYQMGKAGGGWQTMTDAQQNALNSGITSTKVSNYDTHIADTTKHITAAERTAWNAKEDSSNKAKQGTATGSIFTDESTDDQYPSAKAVYTALNAQGTDISGKQDKSTANYQMGNSDGSWTTMTSAQQNALNSGITSTTKVTHTASTAVGSGTKGVYVKADGTTAAMTYSLNKDVPATAELTDTTYTFATGTTDGTISVTPEGGDAQNVAVKGWANKQDKLVAGTNITIAADGKTISATDTTYNEFTGATSSADGAAGLVKKPLKANVNQFLRGDGSWATPTDTNTTYETMSVDEGTTGTATTKRVVTAKNLKDTIQGTKLTGIDTSTTGTVTATDTITTGIGKLQATKQDKLVAGTNITIAADGKTISATDTTYDVFTTSANGLVPKASASGATGKFLRGDGSWAVPTDTNTTYSVFTGATSSSDGSTGLVKKPVAGDQDKFLKGDGTWSVDRDTTYSVFTGANGTTAGTSGLVKAPAATDSTKFLKGDGTWGTPTDTNTTYTASNGVTLTGTNFTNSGVRAVSASDSSAANGTIKVNTNGTDAHVAVKGWSTKQDKLVAGTNITIAADGKTISATDTTYDVFDGASADAAGSTGLVPAPAKGDQAKFLRADGAWVVPTNTTYETMTVSEGTTGTATTKRVVTAKNLKDTIQGTKLTGIDTSTTGTVTATDTITTGIGKLQATKQDKLTPGSNITINGNTISATNTTYDVFTTSANGLVPKASASGATGKFLRGDGTWATPTNTTYNVFTGATSSSDGSTGLVKKPVAGDQDKFLKGDGTWSVDRDTTYSVFTGANGTTAGTSGLVKAPAATDSTKFLKGDGTWGTPTDTNTTYTASNGVTLTGTNFTNSGVRAVSASDSSAANGTIKVNTNGTDAHVAVKGWSTKQDKLVAGTNITIAADGKTISATDTTYNEFTGATSGADGAAGLVKKPLIANRAQFLRGDGTWATPTNTTYSVFTGATSSSDGTTGLVKKPVAGDQDKFLKGDGTWSVDRDTTYSVFTGATSSADGAAGLVKKPLKANVNQFLKGDGTWATPTDTNTTYSAGTGLSLSGTTFSNAGVRSVTESASTAADGTIAVNTNGATTNPAVKGWANKQTKPSSVSNGKVLTYTGTDANSSVTAKYIQAPVATNDPNDGGTVTDLASIWVE